MFLLYTEMLNLSSFVNNFTNDEPLIISPTSGIYAREKVAICKNFPEFVFFGGYHAVTVDNSPFPIINCHPRVFYYLPC